MVVWAKRRYSPSGYAADVETFRERFERRRQQGALMIEAVADYAQYHRDVYVAVPDKMSLVGFVGYQHVEEKDLPKSAALLAGDGDDFKKRFA